MGKKLRRKFEILQDPRGSCLNLTVLQWNVLADGLAQNGDFERVSPIWQAFHVFMPQLALFM
jgi:hypothetical protein